MPGEHNPSSAGLPVEWLRTTHTGTLTGRHIESLIAEIDWLRSLAWDLVGTLAAVRSAYEVATASHPDDDVRTLHLGMSESLILAAREALDG